MNNAEEYSTGMSRVGGYDADDAIKCPVCGCEFVRPAGVIVNVGGVITIIEEQIPWITRGTPTGRGVSIWLHFACEEGHRWTERYQFHEGWTLKELVIHEPSPLPGWPPTIWRD